MVLILASLSMLLSWSFHRKLRKFASLPPPLDRLMCDLDEKEPWYSRRMRELAAKLLMRNRNTGIIAAPLYNTSIRTSNDVRSRNHSAMIKLCDMGTNAYPAIDALVSCLQEKDLTTGFNAYNVLCLIHADDDPRFAQALHSCANNTNVLNVFDYMLDGNSSRLIFFNLYKYSPEFQRFALRAIAQRDVDAKTLLPKVMRLASPNVDFETRKNAIVCLGAIGPAADKAVPLLKQIVQNRNEYPQIRGPALEALTRIAPNDPQTIPLLKEMITNQHTLARVKAALGLWRLRAISTEEVLPVLEPALEHKLASVRVSTLQGIYEMGPVAQPLKSKVETCLTDQDEGVRTSAKLALSKLGP